MDRLAPALPTRAQPALWANRTRENLLLWFIAKCCWRQDEVSLSHVPSPQKKRPPSSGLMAKDHLWPQCNRAIGIWDNCLDSGLYHFWPGIPDCSEHWNLPILNRHPSLPDSDNNVLISTKKQLQKRLCCPYHKQKVEMSGPNSDRWTKSPHSSGSHFLMTGRRDKLLPRVLISITNVLSIHRTSISVITDSDLENL